MRVSQSRNCLFSSLVWWMYDELGDRGWNLNPGAPLAYTSQHPTGHVGTSLLHCSGAENLPHSENLILRTSHILGREQGALWSWERPFGVSYHVLRVLQHMVTSLSPRLHTVGALFSLTLWRRNQALKNYWPKLSDSWLSSFMLL